MDREELAGRVKVTTESKPGSGKQRSRQGDGWKDIELTEKCWAYADARRGILRQKKKSRQYQGAKQEARTDGLKRDFA